MIFGVASFGATSFSASDVSQSTVPAIVDLIADQEADRCYLFEATPYNPESGAEVSVRASIGLDVPIVNAQHWPAILRSAVDSAVELFDGTNETAQGRTSFGVIDLLIGDGEHDELIGYNWSGRDVEIKLGAPDFDFSDYVTVVKGTAEDITYTDSVLSIVLRGKEEFLDNQVQENVYSGTGGRQGDGNLAGTTKPLAYGELFNVLPVLVDEANLIYQWHDGSSEALVAAFDGGAALTSLGDVADIEATTVPAGYYKTQLSGGYIRLGAAPEKSLTIDVKGHNIGGYIESWSDIAKDIVLNRTELSASDLNLASFETARLDSMRAVCGLYLTGNETVSNILTELAVSVGGSWCFNRVGLLTLGVLRGRLSSDSVNQNDIVKQSFSRARTTPPSWRRRIGYKRAWTVQTENDFLGNATEGRRNFALNEYRYATNQDTTVQTRHKSARIVELDTLLATSSDGEATAARLQSLFGGKPEHFQITLRRSQFKYAVGDTITLQYDRYNINQDAVILAIRENTTTQRTALNLLATNPSVEYDLNDYTTSSEKAAGNWNAGVSRIISTFGSNVTIYIPSGTYTQDSNHWDFAYSGLTVRGDGDNTILSTSNFTSGRVVMTNNGASLGRWDLDNPWPITGAIKGNTYVTVSDASNISVGEVIFIGAGSNNFDPDYGELNIVTQVTNDNKTVFLQYPLGRSYNLDVAPYNQKTVANITMPAVDATTTVNIALLDDTPYQYNKTVRPYVSIGSNVFEVTAVSGVSPYTCTIRNPGFAVNAEPGTTISADTKVVKCVCVYRALDTPQNQVFKDFKINDTSNPSIRSLDANSIVGATFENITVTGTYTTGSTWPVTVDQSLDLTFTNCQFINQSATWSGHGVSRASNLITFNSCLYEDVFFGAGEFAGEVTWDNCTFDLDFTDNRGSIYSSIFGKTTKRLTFTNNTVNLTGINYIFDTGDVNNWTSDAGLDTDDDHVFAGNSFTGGDVGICTPNAVSNGRVGVCDG